MAKRKEWVIKKLQEFLDDEMRGQFSWPLDEDYDEHIKFVGFRNSNEHVDFIGCVEMYLEKLLQ